MDALQWCGGDIDLKSVGDAGGELRALNSLLERFFGTVCQADGALNLPAAVLHAIEDLERAYSLAGPVFGIAALPIGRRAANSAEYSEILAQLVVAEISCFTAISRARSEWLFRVMRDANPPEEG